MRLGLKSAIFIVCHSFVIVTKHPKIAHFIVYLQGIEAVQFPFLQHNQDLFYFILRVCSHLVE